MGAGGCSLELQFPSHLKAIFAEKHTNALRSLMYRPTTNLLSSHDSKERGLEMIDRLCFRETEGCLFEQLIVVLLVTLQKIDLFNSHMTLKLP